MDKKLETIKKIELRKAWNHEAEDFTKWLSEPENIGLLSNEIGIDIKLVQVEANVGRYNVDILAEEENTGRKIIIENQLEFTNHDHLGKLITYASGYNAGIIVWIVKDVREEHRQAIDWLNEHTDEDIYFFLVKIELWQIGDSPFASKFDIISKPNDWAKAVKESFHRAELTETKIQQLEFWNKLKDYGSNKGSRLSFTKTYPQHWYNFSIGSAKAHLSLVMNTKNNLITCELWIPNDKELFKHLFANKGKIESEIGNKLEWKELPDKKASKINISTSAYIEKVEKWDLYFDWLLKEAEMFKKVFSKYLKDKK